MVVKDYGRRERCMEGRSRHHNCTSSPQLKYVGHTLKASIRMVFQGQFSSASLAIINKVLCLQ